MYKDISWYILLNLGSTVKGGATDPKGSRCWNCAKAVVPYIERLRYGKIINVSSDSFLGGVPGFIHYISSKGAVFASHGVCSANGRLSANATNSPKTSPVPRCSWHRTAATSSQVRLLW